MIWVQGRNADGEGNEYSALSKGAVDFRAFKKEIAKLNKLEVLSA